MPLDPDSVGAACEPRTITWDSKDALLYAVSIGAGEADLAFSTENSQDIEQQVYPTFPVVVNMSTDSFESSAMGKVGDFNLAMAVHGNQGVTLHRPIPTEGTATTVDKVVAMYDKGKAAVVITEAEAVLSTGEALWTVRASTFIRGEGGWGGDRGPSGPVNEPPDRKPDHEMTVQTANNQAFIYRLNGDRNPLHSDPAFAAKAGFDRPILHGLCTYGFTGRVLLSTYCDNDASRFRHIEGRFSSPVFPGEALTIRSWDIDDGSAVFTTDADGRIVIDQGLVRFE